MSISTPQPRPVVAAAAVGIMACRRILRIWMVLTMMMTSWWWWTTVVVVSAAFDHPNEDNNDDDWVSPLLNRQIRTRIVASDWGTRRNVHSVWCELYTLLQQYGSSSSSSSSSSTTATTRRDQDEESEVTWSTTFPQDDEEQHAAQRFLHHLTTHHDQIHDRLRNPHSPNHWDPVIRDILWGSTTSSTSLSSSWTDSTRRLLHYMMVMRTTSPTCELHRTLLAATTTTTATSPIEEDETDIAVTMIIYPIVSSNTSTFSTTTTTVAPPPRRVDLRHDGNVTPDLVRDVLRWGMAPHDDASVRVPPSSQYHHPDDTTTTTATQRMDRLVKEHVLPGEIVYQSSPRSTSASSSSSSSTSNTNHTLEDPCFVVVYGLLGTRQFAALYPILLSLERPVTFVVRHRGTSTNKEDTDGPPTILQGYGVRLDIRNVEYKVFDDRRTTLPTTTTNKSSATDQSDDKDESTVVVDENGLYNVSHIFQEQMRHHRSTMIQHHAPILAGVNATKLWESRRPIQNNNGGSSSTPTEFMELQRQLWKIHDTQMVTSQIIPPVWQRRQLPMQVASVVAAAPDPLTTFQHLIQNLPSVASTLVHVKVPEIVVNATTVIGQSLRQSFQSGLVYVNGRIATSLERPTFNVFELLKLIREEQGQLHNIESLLIMGGPGTSPLFNATARSSLLRDIQNAWMMGRKFSQNDENDNDENEHNNAIAGRTEKAKKIVRIDVGRGWKKAVLYLNDVEKDAQYEMWPTSLREMLMKMQYGMPPTVRRNIFTILCVLDPLQPWNEYTNTETMNGGDGVVENVGYNLGTQLMHAAYPARIGLLLASESDIQQCLQWMSTTNDDGDDESCPVSPIFRAPVPTKITELQSIPATTHAIHRLLVTFTVDENTEMGTIFHLCDFLFLSILDEQKDSVEPLSMYQLLLIYGKYIAAMGARSDSQGMDDGFQLLLRDESTITSYSYGRSVRFAVDKRLKPGMSFMNGRPLPTDPGANDAISTVFSEEQQYIFGLIVNGDITDTSPKSIYAKLLSGDGLYKKFHPLLSMKPKSASSSDESSPMDLKHDISPTNSFLRAGTDNAGVFPIDANAYFVIDAFFHYHSQSGIDLMKMFIKMMKSLPYMLDASSTGVMYRILPSSALASKSIICPIVSNAAHLGISAIEHLLGSITVSHGIDDLEKLLNTVDGLSEQVRTTILTSASGDGPCSTIKLKNQQHFSIGNAIAANGHVFPIEGNSVDHDDLELLLRLEIDRAKAVTNLLRPHVPFSNADAVDLVRKVAVFLMEEETSRSGKRNNVNQNIERIASQLESKENPLHFSWNTDEGDESLKVQVTVILDPVSEAAQRFTPLLKVIRDKLKLPLQLLLAPALVLEGDDKIPITSYYRFVGDPTSMADEASAGASFSNLPTNHLLTLQVDVPEPWNVQQKSAVQDTDNLRCDIRIGCSDDMDSNDSDYEQVYERQHHTNVEYDLKNLLIFGQCYEMTNGSPPNGLQLTLSRSSSQYDPTQLPESVEIGLDGESLQNMVHINNETEKVIYSDTLVMKNVGYWQLPANPGVWNVGIADGSEGANMFEIIAGSIKNGALAVSDVITPYSTKKIVMQDFVSRGEVLLVRRRPGYETANLFSSNDQKTLAASADDDVIHVFSLATGHLYERFLKIMMLSVTKRTSSKVKFWLFENFLSPTFKASAQAMAKRIGCEVEFVTYKWPEWLRAQSEKQRIIWGYKILFLDVLFPMNVKKIIYVDADQVVRADLKELWDMDLQGHVYGYTPFCTSRNTTLGFQFWREGFWKNHLGDKPYHISALYVVDLELFRRNLVGDVLRSTYQQLSADPNSLANLDQDLPNFAQKQVPIFSLPQEWLWCESWCSDETKATSKTIDLCNNPLHKEPKVSMAKRIISGSLFNESWVELDAEVERYEQEYYATTTGIGL